MKHSPYLARHPRTISEVLAGVPPRVLMWDEGEPMQRCKNHGCNLPLYTAAEERRGECWPCLKERS